MGSIYIFIVSVNIHFDVTDLCRSVTSMWRQRLLNLLGPVSGDLSGPSATHCNPLERRYTDSELLPLPSMAAAGLASDARERTGVLQPGSMRNGVGMRASVTKGLDHRSGSAVPEHGDDLLSRWRSSRPHSAGCIPGALGKLRKDIASKEWEGSAELPQRSSLEEGHAISTASDYAGLDRPRIEELAELDPLAAFRVRLAAVSGCQRSRRDIDSAFSAPSLLAMRPASQAQHPDRMNVNRGITCGDVTARVSCDTSTPMGLSSANGSLDVGSQRFMSRETPAHVPKDSQFIDPLVPVPADNSFVPASMSLDASADVGGVGLVPEQEVQERPIRAEQGTREGTAVAVVDMESGVATHQHATDAPSVCATQVASQSRKVNELASSPDLKQPEDAKGYVHDILQTSCNVANSGQRQDVTVPGTQDESSAAYVPESYEPTPDAVALTCVLTEDSQFVQHARTREIHGAAIAGSAPRQSVTTDRATAGSNHSGSDGPDSFEGDTSKVGRREVGNSCSAGDTSQQDNTSSGSPSAKIDRKDSSSRSHGGADAVSEEDDRDLASFQAGSSRQQKQNGSHAGRTLESLLMHGNPDRPWDDARGNDWCAGSDNAGTVTCDTRNHQAHESDGNKDYVVRPNGAGDMPQGLQPRATSKPAASNGGISCTRKASDTRDPWCTGAVAKVQADNNPECGLESLAGERTARHTVGGSNLSCREVGSGGPGEPVAQSLACDMRGADSDTGDSEKSKSEFCKASFRQDSSRIGVVQAVTAPHAGGGHIVSSPSCLSGLQASDGCEAITSPPSGGASLSERNPCIPLEDAIVLDMVSAVTASHSSMHVPHSSAALPPRSPVLRIPSPDRERSCSSQMLTEHRSCNGMLRDDLQSGAGHQLQSSEVAEVFEHYFADLFGSPDRSQARSTGCECSKVRSTVDECSQVKTMSAECPNTSVEASLRTRQAVEHIFPTDACSTQKTKDALALRDLHGGWKLDDHGDCRTDKEEKNFNLGAPAPLCAGSTSNAASCSGDTAVRIVKSEPASAARARIPQPLDVEVLCNMPGSHCHSDACMQDVHGGGAALVDKRADVEYVPTVGAMCMAAPACPSPVPLSRVRYRNDSRSSSSPDSPDCMTITCSISQDMASSLTERGAGSAVHMSQNSCQQKDLTGSPHVPCSVSDEELGGHSAPCEAHESITALDRGIKSPEVSASGIETRASLVSSRDGVNAFQKSDSGSSDKVQPQAPHEGSVTSSAGRSHSTQAGEAEEGMWNRRAFSPTQRSEWAVQVPGDSGDCPWDEPICNSAHMDGIVVVSNTTRMCHDSVAPTRADDRCGGHASKAFHDCAASAEGPCDADRHCRPSPRGKLNSAGDKRRHAAEDGAELEAQWLPEKTAGKAHCAVNSEKQAEPWGSGDKSCLRMVDHQGSWKSVLAVAAGGDSGPCQQPELVSTERDLHHAAREQSQQQPVQVSCGPLATQDVQERSLHKFVRYPVEQCTSMRDAERRTVTTGCPDVQLEMHAAASSIEVTASLDKWLFSAHNENVTSGANVRSTPGGSGIVDLQLQGLLLEEAEVLSSVLLHGKADKRSQFSEPRLCIQQHTVGTPT
jgi:hypothetical protein